MAARAGFAATGRRRVATVVWALFFVVIAGLGTLGGLGTVDAWITDTALRNDPRPVARDVVIVAIDDISLARIGRWPWPRDVHARLLDVLTDAGSRAVGLDVIFSEPDATYDIALAGAMQRHGRVVLPLRLAPMDGHGELVSLPVPTLAAAAAGLGQLHLDRDADGAVRALFLEEGFGNVLWDHFALALWKVADPAAADLPAGDTDDAAIGRWRRTSRFIIPFAGPSGSVHRVPFVDVLEGRVPPGLFRDAIVLVGATAPGLTDAYPTPVARREALMPGVEISAQALMALREGRHVRRPTPWQGAALAVLPSLVAFAVMRRSRPRTGMAVTLLLMAMVPAAVWVMQRTADLQWPPAAALLGLALLLPLWSWQRLETALAYLALEFQRVRERLPAGGALAAPLRGGDELDRRMAALSAAAHRLRQLEVQRQEALDFLSHDLRAPLTSTLALIELAPAGDDRATLSAIEGQARRALALAEGFVQLARAESPDGAPVSTLDLRDVVVDAIDSAWAPARQQGMRLTSDAPDRECLVDGDATLLSRAVGNLIDNALKHGDADHGAVHCALVAAEAGWHIEVHSGGDPLAPDVARTLFHRFRRGVTASADTARPGAGLGLAIVDAVAGRHGGHAGWRPAAHGNVFFIALPSSPGALRPERQQSSAPLA